MNPIRIKASATPIGSANFQGLQEMTNNEINQYLSAIITQKFADDTDGTGTAEINVDTTNSLSGNSIGSWTNQIRNDAIGTHPTDGSTVNTTYYFKQVTSSATENITTRPVGYDSGIKEFSDAAIDTDIIDNVIEDMVIGSGYTVGQYHLSASAPAGGTWTARYTITDSTQSGNNTVYLWQKTAPSLSGNADLASLKLDGTNVKMMSVAEIEQLVPNFRNRIISSGIGTYKLQTSIPVSAGTWVQAGDALVDTRQEVASENYSGTYTGNYTGNYTGSYSGTYSSFYTGSFTGSYTGFYTGPDTFVNVSSASFSGTYAGTYAGTAGYAGAYSNTFIRWNPLYYSGFVAGYYTGFYTGYFTGFYTGAANYTGYYTGSYDRTYIGYYEGTSQFAGTYTGYYSRNFSSSFVGSYTGVYAGTYSGDYAGTYAGDTVQATTENTTTVRLWLRTA